MILFPKRQPQTFEEYVQEQCQKHEIDREEYLKIFDVEPCKCPYAGCTGWLAIPK